METDHTGDDFSAAKQNDCPAVDFRPAKRWGASKQDVWSVINEGAEASRIKPCVNLSPSQEAAAAVYEQSLYNGFWSQTRTLVREKMIRLCQVFQKLDLPYTIPEGGYFVLVNLAKVQIPREYRFPPHIRDRRRDFLLAWFLIMELGVAAIPASEYYSPEHACLGKNYLRFAICQNDDILN
ncbi:hypothetical protein AtubIFM57143_002191 [Aspergillus tubingensis]|nr:hypothetical protein AtubIFM57143_002191 [Aspergillus tubingensis]